MKLSLHQINNLITGIQLAAELPASTLKNRHFISVIGYNFDEDGRARKPNNILHSSKEKSLFFVIWEYEISSEYIENGWDVTEDEFERYNHIKDIHGIANLEIELSKFINDFAMLVPAWECDNPI